MYLSSGSSFLTDAFSAVAKPKMDLNAFASAAPEAPDSLCVYIMPTPTPMS